MTLPNVIKTFFLVYIVGLLALGAFIYIKKTDVPTQYRYFINIELNNIEETYDLNPILKTHHWLSKYYITNTIFRNLPIYLQNNDLFLAEFFATPHIESQNSWYCSFIACDKAIVKDVPSPVQILSVLETRFSLDIERTGKIMEISFFSSDDEQARRVFKSLVQAIVDMQTDALQRKHLLTENLLNTFLSSSPSQHKQAIIQLKSRLIFNSYMQVNDMTRKGDIVLKDFKTSKPNRIAWFLAATFITFYLGFLGWLTIVRVKKRFSILPMKISKFLNISAIILFLFVILDFIGFFRDALFLPLYNGRTQIVECGLLLLAISMVQSNFDYPKLYNASQNSIEKKIVNFFCFLGIPHNFNKFAILFFTLACILVPISLINHSPDLFFCLQLSKFFLALVFLSSIKNWNLGFTYVERYLFFFIIVILLILGIIYLIKDSGILSNSYDLMSRNGWALTAVFYHYFFAFKKGFRFFIIILFICLLISFISGSKLALIFNLLSPVCYFLLRKKYGSVLVRGVWAIFLLIFVIIVPYIIPMYFRFNFEDLYVLGNFRYFVQDDIGSLISRVFSVRHLFESGQLSLLGAGEMPGDAGKFWGYPVHNIIIELGYKHGLVGWLVGLTLATFFVRFSRRVYEIILLISVMMYSNDINSVYVLCFILIKGKFSTTQIEEKCSHVR